MPALVNKSYMHGGQTSKAAYTVLVMPNRELSVSSIRLAYPVEEQTGINNRVLRLLEEFSTLKENWDEEGAQAPNPQAIGHAKNLVQLLSRTGQPVFHTAPGPHGEVMVDIRNGKRSLEILYYPEKTRYVKFSEAGVAEQGDFRADQLTSLLSWLNG